MKKSRTTITRITKRTWKFSSDEVESALREVHGIPHDADFTWEGYYDVACTFDHKEETTKTEDD